MSIRKELGSKRRKEVLSSIYAPGISASILKKNVQFLMRDDKRGKDYIFDINQQISFFSYKDLFLPSLMFIRKYPELDIPTVQVDAGAVKFVINGADIFTQGIVSCSQDFDENTIIVILNPQNAALSLGSSLMKSSDLLTKKGRGIVNLHYLGDKIWEMEL
ncbi:MAG: PUA domain-containing protein [Candidatus Hodarchaeales archaeon]|jgi:PUA domain protein